MPYVSWNYSMLISLPSQTTAIQWSVPSRTRFVWIQRTDRSASVLMPARSGTLVSHPHGILVSHPHGILVSHPHGILVSHLHSVSGTSLKRPHIRVVFITRWSLAKGKRIMIGGDCVRKIRELCFFSGLYIGVPLYPMKCVFPLIRNGKVISMA